MFFSLVGVMLQLGPFSWEFDVYWEEFPAKRCHEKCLTTVLPTYSELEPVNVKWGQKFYEVACRESHTHEFSRHFWICHSIFYVYKCLKGAQYSLELQDISSHSFFNSANLMTDSLLIYIFCTDREHEIVVVLICRSGRIISCSHLVQNI